MELFLIRHAIADDGADDDARPLSAKGKKKFAEVVRGLAALEVRFDRVLHSHKLRALETADLLAPVTDGELEVTPLLAAAPSRALLHHLVGDTVAAVGHEPWLSELLAWLVTGDGRHGKAIDFKKGGVAWLSGEPRPAGMALVALLPPRVARLVR